MQPNASNHPNPPRPGFERINQTYSERRVHRVRIEVHNLRKDDGWERQGRSENHVTCALMLGNGQSVRIDMTPDADTHQGTMVLQGRERIVSRRTLRLTDINATGCQNNFDPDWTPSLHGRGLSVATFVNFLLDHHLDRYRFIYVDSHAMGCRYLV
jgi:hypothetical protein